MLCIAHGMLWNEVTPENLLKFDVDGNIIEGDGVLEITALNIHARMHLARKKNVAVFHTHMPYTSALTCTQGGKLEMCHQNSLRFYNRICYVSYNGLVFDTKEGDRLAAQMSDKDIMLHDNHGVMLCANSIAEAFNDLYYLERSAQIQVLAMSTGKPLKIIPDDVAQEFMDIFLKEEPWYAQQHFAALKREYSARKNRI